MPLQFQNYAQAYANPVQTVARDRSQSIKDIGSAIDEMIAKSDLAKEKTTRSNLLSDVDNKKVQVLESEISSLKKEYDNLSTQRFEKLSEIADINSYVKMQQDYDDNYDNIAGTSTDTENTIDNENTNKEFEYGDAAI